MVDITCGRGVKRVLKQGFKFAPNYKALVEQFGIQNTFVIPCGKCDACKKAYRRMWSLRAEAEARLYKDNCFVTLTMDNDNVTKEVSKEHLQKFFRALRDKGFKFRYFACGEYGRHPMTGDRERPHYHAILFGFFPPDAKAYVKSKSGDWMFTSDLMTKTWQKGFVTIQSFEPAAAGYVAGYVDKKESEEDGFLMMSTRPGLGYDYYRKHMEELAEFDSFISKGGFKSTLPRYFEKAASDAWFDITDLKIKRMQRTSELSVGTAQAHGFEHMEEIFKYQGEQERRKKKNARNL